MIDLHLHTKYSDGTDSLKELLENAEEKKLEIISITDHDKIGAYFELENNSKLRNLYSGKILVGSEIKTHYNGVSIEVLAYGFDYNKIKLPEIDIIELQKKYLVSLKNVLDKLGFFYNDENLYIDTTDSKKQWAAFVIASEVMKYSENQELLKQYNITNPALFIRTHQSNKNSEFYIDESKDFLGLEEIIKIIHDAGGLAFLAHGFIYPFKNKSETIEEILKTTDIDGLECIYPLFNEDEKMKAIELADKYGKYKSGGTDYHAKNKPNIMIGTGINNNVNVDVCFVSDWIDKCKLI